MKEIELERAFLVKKLPPDLHRYKPVLMRMGDFYDPKIHNGNRVDVLNIRQRGDKYVIRKKEGKSEYKKIEHTIYITKKEFELLMTVTTQKHEKYYYLYPLNKKYTSEIDIYLGKLKGYARVEVEFKNTKDQKNFIPPDWFGPEITPLNHSIHKNLGIITFNDLKKRYRQKNINLQPILIPKKYSKHTTSR